MMGINWLGKGLLVLSIAAGFIFAGSGSCLAVKGNYAKTLHGGEEISNQNLLEVKTVGGGKIQLVFERPFPAFVAPDFTISQCGLELAPNVATLNSMVGKPSKGWASYVDGAAVYSRLEFECR